MIHFQLKCSRDHEFEAWFRSSASFAEQVKRGDVDCPVCGDIKITKALMAPNIATSKKAAPDPSENRAREVAQQILEAAGKLRKVVEENCEYVGDNFAEEARAIHYGETEERGIFGEATDQEVEQLDEEGIQTTRLPALSPRTRKNS